MISVNLNQINDVLTDFDECVRNIFSTRHQKLRIIFFSGERRKKFFQILFRKRAYSKRNKLGLDYEELRIGIFSDTMSFENTNRTFHREKCSRFKTFPTYGSDRNQSGLRFTDTRCGYTFTILLYLAILFFTTNRILWNY